MELQKSALVDISEIVACYLPVSRKKARKFVALYLEPKKIGGRIFVDRQKLEALLADANRTDFPLEV